MAFRGWFENLWSLLMRSDVVPVDRDVVLLDFRDGDLVSGGKAAADLPEGLVLGLWEDQVDVDDAQQADHRELQEHIGLQRCLCTQQEVLISQPGKRHTVAEPHAVLQGCPKKNLPKHLTL